MLVKPSTSYAELGLPCACAAQLHDSHGVEDGHHHVDGCS